MKEKSEADKLLEAVLSALQSGKPLTGKDGALTPMIKHVLEASLEGEMDAHVESARPNRRNGKGKKRVKTSSGEIEIETPRDRDGTYEPSLIPKRQRALGDSLEKKIIGLYSSGMSYQDISDHIDEMYDMNLSKAQLSAITDRVWPEIEEWRSRPLDSVYVFLWMDAMFFKVKQDGRVKQMAAYMALGMNVEGEKDLLGIYLSETESSGFWLGVLNDLEARGVEDIIIASIDNLKGFKEVITTVFPRTDVQLCIVHQIRNSTRYVNWQDKRAVVRDMRLIYRVNSIAQAETELENFEEKWGKKYPAMIQSWKRNWEHLTTFFGYDEHVKRVMYTTNSIEGFNRQVRKGTKAKGVLTSERALLKLLYLVTQKVQKKWSRPQSWSRVIASLMITHRDRLRLK